jgi:hypothetical protein
MCVFVSDGWWWLGGEAEEGRMKDGKNVEKGAEKGGTHGKKCEVGRNIGIR